MHLIRYMTIAFLLFQPMGFADSTRVKPLQNLTVFSAGVENAPPQVSNARYDLLPVCPSTPTHCPDINGKGGNPHTCPDACTVTRSPNVLTTSPGTNKVNIHVKEAVCPPLYKQVATYNMQNEAVYNASPPPVQPINGMSTYHRYLEAGYTCSIYGNQYLSHEYCNGAFIDNQITDAVNNANGHVVQILNSYRSSCYCSAFGCGATCNCNVLGVNPRWTYRYYYIQCRPPAGVYLTGHVAPVSAVCARSKSVWQPVH